MPTDCREKGREGEKPPCETDTWVGCLLDIPGPSTLTKGTELAMQAMPGPGIKPAAFPSTGLPGSRSMQFSCLQTFCTYNGLLCSSTRDFFFPVLGIEPILKNIFPFPLVLHLFIQGPFDTMFYQLELFTIPSFEGLQSIHAS